MNSLLDPSAPSADPVGTRCCNAERLARAMQALAHPVRIDILRQLACADACCCKDVVGRLNLAQSTVSQHLKVLVEAGLVRMRPERQSSRYSVDREALLALSEAVGGLLTSCAAPANKPQDKG